MPEPTPNELPPPTGKVPAIAPRQLPGDTSKASQPPAQSAAERWRPLWWLPCELAPQVPVARFTVRELLRLHPGSVVSTGWSCSKELPLYANAQLIGWAELDSVGDHIGARITELG